MNPNNLLEAFFEGYRESIRLIVREEVIQLKTELKNFVPKEEKYRNRGEACKVLGYGRNKGAQVLDEAEASGKLHPVGSGRGKRYLESELLALGKK